MVKVVSKHKFSCTVVALAFVVPWDLIHTECPTTTSWTIISLLITVTGWFFTIFCVLTFRICAITLLNHYQESLFGFQNKRRFSVYRRMFWLLFLTETMKVVIWIVQSILLQRNWIVTIKWVMLHIGNCMSTLAMKDVWNWLD